MAVYRRDFDLHQTVLAISNFGKEPPASHACASIHQIEMDRAHAPHDRRCTSS
jgi:hypothetical protein